MTRGVFTDGEIHGHVAIMWENCSVFAGVRDEARGVWIGGVLDSNNMLTVGEFDFDNTGQSCVQLVPNFLAREPVAPGPGRPNNPYKAMIGVIPGQNVLNTQELSAQENTHSNGLPKVWCNACGYPTLGETRYC